MQPTATLTGEPPIDLVHLRRYTLGDAALEREILGLFVDQAPLTLADLDGATTAKAWSMAAHTLKGSSRSVGAVELGRLATSAEVVDFADPEARSEAVARLAAALERARQYIFELSDRSPA